MRLAYKSALLGIAAGIILTVATACAIAQTPEMILGTEDSQYKLYTPQAVVKAGGGGGEATPLSDATPQALGTAAAGSASAASRGDHVHPTTGINQVSEFQSSNANDCLRVASDGSAYGWRDCPSGGGGATPLSDATPQPLGTAAAGSASAASRGDHVHALPAIPSASDTNPTALGNANAGSNATYSRSDHRHPTTGIRQYPNFTSANAGQCFRINTAGSAALWADCPSGGGASLSDATPQPVGVAAPGDGTSASREDHVHGPDPQTAINTTAIDDLLPSTSGNAGKFLKVNSAATGVEWAEGSGGGGGGGLAVELNQLFQVGPTSGNGSVSLNAAQSTALRSSWNDTSVLYWIATAGGNSGTDAAIGLRNAEGPVSEAGDCKTAVGILNCDIYFYWNTSETTPRPIYVRLRGTGRGDTFSSARIRPAAGSVTFTFYEVKISGGGGGSSGPNVPNPTLLDRNRILKVNNAGGAYEFGPVIPNIPGIAAAGRALVVNSLGTAYQYGVAPANRNAVEVPSKTLAATGSVLTADCSGQGLNCTTGFKAIPRQFGWEAIANGSFQHAGGGSANVNIPQTGSNALLHNHIISGRYQEFVAFVRFNEVTDEGLTNCRLSGVFPGDTLNNQRRVVSRGIGVTADGNFARCTLNVPASGNAQLGWTNLGKGGLNTTFQWALYGVRW